MTSRRVAALAGLIVLGLAGPAMAQVPMIGGNLPTFDNAPPAPPPGAAPGAAMGPPMGMPPGAPGGGMPGRPQAGPPGGDACAQGFVPLREEADKRGKLLKAMMEKAQQTKTPPKREEACKQFRGMAVILTKMLTFVTENKVACGIPDEAIQGIKAGHDNMTRNRDNACASGPIGAAPAGPPPGPKLSDELGVGNIGRSTTPGRGTFDTLSGNALAR